MAGPQGTKPGQSRRPRASPALLVKEHEVPLAEGETLIGRCGDAKISILGSLVSRKHARLICRDARVTVEDMGSRNGVFVNGVKLDAPVLLEDGDTLLIGTTQLTYFLGTPDEAPPTQARAIFDEQGNMMPEGEVVSEWNTRTALKFESDTVDFDREDVTIQGTRPPSPRLSSALLQKPPAETEPPPTPRVEAPGAPQSGALPKVLAVGRVSLQRPGSSRPRQSAPPPRVGPVTRPTPSPPTAAAPPPRSGSFAVPGQDPLLAALGIIDRMLARGDADAASRVLAGHVAKRIESARAGAALPAEALEGASLRCASLLELTGDPTWFDAVMDLHSVAKAPMALAVLDRVTPFAGVVPTASQERLFRYQDVVRELLGEVDVDALEACDRILSLEP